MQVPLQWVNSDLPADRFSNSKPKQDAANLPLQGLGKVKSYKCSHPPDTVSFLYSFSGYLWVTSSGQVQWLH